MKFMKSKSNFPFPVWPFPLLATLLLAFLTLFLLPSARGAEAAVAGAEAAPTNAVATPAPASEPIVLERGPNHKIIQTPTGGQYTELADNLCYLSTNGVYLDSQDLIELLDEGKSGA